ncbi:hypothetical protein G6F37_011427 [Rhizopus arrhizus]|nr:hypothetical protein G6F38_011387 [Rhizopus arrhizus]KAG1149385.1 hypothetical protein G6F37_011427 [Rhizopus arrhizus]
MLASDSPPHPRLSARLIRDLQNRTVKLNDMTWQVILNTSTDPDNVTDYPFVTWLTRSLEWVSLSSSIPSDSARFYASLSGSYHTA